MRLVRTFPIALPFRRASAPSLGATKRGLALNPELCSLLPSLSGAGPA